MSKGKKALIVILIILVVLVIVAGIMLFLLPHQRGGSQTAGEVKVSVTIPDYTASTDSPVPFHLDGTSTDGKTMTKDGYVESGKDQTVATLPAGSYTMTMKASPILAAGTMFDVSTVTVEVEIDDEGEVSYNGSALAPSYTLVATDMSKVTEEQIENSYKAATASGMDKTKADALKTAAYAARAAALNSAAAGTIISGEQGVEGGNPAAVTVAERDMLALTGTLSAEGGGYVLTLPAPVELTYPTTTGGQATATITSISVSGDADWASAAGKSVTVRGYLLDVTLEDGQVVPAYQDAELVVVR